MKADKYLVLTISQYVTPCFSTRLEDLAISSVTNDKINDDLDAEKNLVEVTLWRNI